MYCDGKLRGRQHAATGVSAPLQRKKIRRESMAKRESKFVAAAHFWTGIGDFLVDAAGELDNTGALRASRVRRAMAVPEA
jgi:hypothetical protein